MYVMTSLLKYMFLYVLFVRSPSAGKKLNFPKLLLPYNQGIPTNFTLQVFGSESQSSCYVWSSSHPHLVAIFPQYSNLESSCSEKVIVSAFSYFPDRHSVSIRANDKDTGETFYCDVIIDSINTFEISMTTHELYLDGAPELFQVVAKNKQGHTFTSLSGVEFDWKIVGNISTHDDGTSVGILRFLTTTESLYQVPPFLHFWESQGKHGSAVLVAGSKTGAAKLKCRIKNLAYKDVAPYEVSISVLPNIKLTPAHDIYLLPLSTVHYRMDVIKQGRIKEIPVPSDSYFLKVKGTKYVTFDAESGNITANKVGQSSIVLNSYIKSNATSFPVTSAKIYVVEPSYLTLNIFPGQTWALKELTNYIITTQLYDVRHHKMFLADNLKIKLSFPQRFFHMNYSMPNGTYYVLKTVVPGSGQIKAEFVGVHKADGKLVKHSVPIQVEQKFVIYQAVQVTPTFILLPWDPVSQPTYQINLKAVGGTGFYTWTSSNNIAATVTSHSEELSRQAVVNVKGIGNFIITATDMYNPDFSQSTKVSVQLITNLDIIPTVVETEVGSDIIIPVAMYGYEDTEMKKHKIFDDCSKIPVDVQVVEESKFSYIQDADIPPFGRGCKSLQFRCKSVGHSRVFIKYGNGEGALKTTAVIACHKPIKPVHPVRVAVTALATGKEIAFEGGPRPWPLNIKDYYIKLTAENSSMVNITRLYDRFRLNKDLHVFRVVCQEIGETVLSLKIGNNVSPTNPNPAKCETSIRFVCGIPETVHLQPVVKSVKGNAVSGAHVVKIPVSSVKSFEMNFWVKDKLGRKFGNVTSFNILWKLSDYTLAKPKDHRDFITSVDGASSYNKVSRTYQLFELTGKIGHLNITATIVGYISNALKQQNIVNQPLPIKEVTGFTRVELVEKLESNQLNDSGFEHYKSKEEGESCSKDVCEK